MFYQGCIRGPWRKLSVASLSLSLALSLSISLVVYLSYPQLGAGGMPLGVSDKRRAAPRWRRRVNAGLVRRSTEDQSTPPPPACPAAASDCVLLVVYL